MAEGKSVISEMRGSAGRGDPAAVVRDCSGDILGLMGAFIICTSCRPWSIFPILGKNLRWKSRFVAGDGTSSVI